MDSLDSLSRRATLLVLLVLPSICAAGTSDALAGAPLDKGAALHLLNRLAYGPRPGEVERVRAMGARAYVDSQLAAPALPPGLEARLRELAHPDVPPGEAALLAAIASPGQLEEVLAAFWRGWFREEGGDAALRPFLLGSYAALHAAAVRQAHEQGRQLAAGGEREALDALVRHFVSAPSAELRQSLARVWDATGGDQRAVLRALLTSAEFLAPAQWNGKRKDDFRFVVSAVRASGVVVENVKPLERYVGHPLTPGERADFVAQLAGAQLALARAPVPPQRHASSAPPMRVTVPGAAAQGVVAQPGPVLMEAPTPSAAAMARAARSQPADAVRLRALLGSKEFMRY